MSSLMANQAFSDDLLQGENFAWGLTSKGIGSPLLALFNKLVRNLPIKSLEDMLLAVINEAILNEDAKGIVDVFVLAFQTRDIRGGKGERELCFRMIILLHRFYPQTSCCLLKILPDYGSWKDLKLLYELAENTTENSSENDLDNFRKTILTIYAECLRQDEKNYSNGKPVSLAAKWAPRDGRHFKKLARALANEMYPSMKPNVALMNYRNLVSSLNKHLDVAEIHMSGKDWSSIKPGAVPARCFKINRHAFFNQVGPNHKPDKRNLITGVFKRRLGTESSNPRFPDDKDRIQCAENFKTHLEESKKDPKAKKVHGAILHPHELVEECIKILNASVEWSESTPEEVDEVIEAQWRDLREKMLEAGSLGKLIPLVDVSGSMDGTPMNVAVALGILLSEINHEALRNRFITFDRVPKWHNLNPNATLMEKVRSTIQSPWGASTNFEAALKLILDAAVMADLEPAAFDDLVLVVFSDMQFNASQNFYEDPETSQWATTHERLVAAFRVAGMSTRHNTPFPVPHIIYWNLRGDTENHMARFDTPGVSLLSGFSPSILKLFLEGKFDVITNPMHTLRTILDNSRYDKIRHVCAEMDEGLLLSYDIVSGFEQCTVGVSSKINFVK